MHTQIHHLRHGFGGRIVRRIAKLPVIREAIGAVVGCTGALALYGVFEVVRGFIGGGFSVDVVTPLHAAAGAIAAQGTALIGLSSTLALAGACAFIHHRTMSDSSAGSL